MAKENKDNAVTETTVDENQILQKLLKTVTKLEKEVETQKKESEKKDKVIEELVKKIEEKNNSKSEALPDEVIKREKSMRDEVVVQVTINPLDPKNTHVPVLNPITNQVMRVKRGEDVLVPRAVYEILQNSMKADKNTALIAKDLAEKFTEETEKL